MDPPYGAGHEERVLSALQGMKYVMEDTLIIVEVALQTDLDYAQDYGFDIIKEKKYKTNKHVFLRRK